MGTFEPQTVAQLSTVIDDVCKALEQHDCTVPIVAKKAIALRVIELYECGITDPDRLLLEIMADSMWASSNRTSSLSPINGSVIGLL